MVGCGFPVPSSLSARGSMHRRQLIGKQGGSEMSSCAFPSCACG